MKGRLLITSDDVGQMVLDHEIDVDVFSIGFGQNGDKAVVAMPDGRYRTVDMNLISIGGQHEKQN